MTTHVALLRAVNLGPHNKLPMKDLAAIFTAAGGKDVRTFIASGNVLFSAPVTAVSRIDAKVRAAIEKRFGIETPILFRTASELVKVVRSNPFDDDDGSLYVTFLANAPKKADVALLDAKRQESERLVVRGRELFLHLPKGAGQTKLVGALIDKTLRTAGTMRSWRTVTKLAELASSSA